MSRYPYLPAQYPDTDLVPLRPSFLADEDRSSLVALAYTDPDKFLPAVRALSRIAKDLTALQGTGEMVREAARSPRVGASLLAAVQ